MKKFKSIKKYEVTIAQFFLPNTCKFHDNGQTPCFYWQFLKRHFTKTSRKVATCKSIFYKFIKPFYSYVGDEIDLQNYANESKELLKQYVEVFCRDNKL